MDAWRQDQIEIARRNVANGIPDARWCGDPGCDLNGMEHGHGRTLHPVFVNGIDLSGYVTNTELSHDRDDKSVWHDQIAGLQESSITVTGTWETELPTLANIFTEHFPERDITIRVPDGRWQAFKSSLQRWWLLRWLRVRWRVYTTRGIPQIDPETGVVTVSATAPITVATITRRGRP